MIKQSINKVALIVTSLLAMTTTAHAAKPLWTYSAPSPSSVSVSASTSATVTYTVTSKTNAPKSLVLQTNPPAPYPPTPGLTAPACNLPIKGTTCTLTITIDGSQVPASGIHAGPYLCQADSNGAPNINQCYQPSQGKELNITLTNQPPAYTGIYVETGNSLVTFSPDNGATWGYMLSPQGGWYWIHNTWASAVTSDGVMYQATGVPGNGTTGNGAATLIYSTDGITWQQVNNTLPSADNADWVQSVFAVGNTVYVGTGEGYVYSTTDQGTTWLPSTGASSVDGSTVNAIVVDANSIFYAGTSNGNVEYSSNSGQSWTSLPNQPSTGVSISSLAIDTSGTLYVVTADTTTQPQYNTAPLTGTWQSMTALPAGDGNATTIAASGSTVYVGTNNSHVMYTTNKGQTWNGSQLPTDTSGINSLFVNESASLLPLFVESYGDIQINSSSGTSTVIVKNLSSATVTNVHADSTQLPADVTQTSALCASVAPGGTCSITFAASGTNGFTPKVFNIIDGSGYVISRTALVSSITPNGTNYYSVYNVNGTTASVVDNSNASNGVYWGSNGTTDDFTSIWGIAENSTTSTPYPNTTQPAGQTATQYTGQQNCNGATDGSCDSTNIYTYYNTVIAGHPISTTDYAEGLCYANTNGGAGGTGQWYLPAACELNGGIYLNVTTNQFVSCSPTLTSIFSLYSLGALGGNLSTLLSAGGYWGSTEDSAFPQTGAWLQYFAPGGGGYQRTENKGHTLGVRCSRALTI